MNEHHSFDGVAFEVELIETRPGFYRWLCFIEGGHFKKSGDVPEGIEDARAGALRCAEFVIRELRSANPGLIGFGQSNNPA